LEEWNQSLERRVSEGIAHIERLDRLRRFFSPGVADLLLNSHTDDHLKAQRREIVVIFLDIRGYTEFTEAYEPEVVMRVLGEFHAAMGELVMAYDGTLERFTGDGMMIFFNAPIEIQNPALRAVNMAIDMQTKMAQLGADYWLPRGHDLTMGIGIAQGVATIGAIGFEGRRDYGAIGRVTNLSARLCGKARGGQILCCEVIEANISGKVKTTPVPNVTLKGFDQQIKVFQIDQAKNGVLNG
jgi:class 3 adenylate cyclase